MLGNLADESKVVGDDREPEFDADGYPTDRTLLLIEEWDTEDQWSLIRFVMRAWKYPDRFRVDGDRVSISTGGWSGNEDLISAMQRNTLFWACRWYSSTRGGGYEFDMEGAR